MLVSGCGGRGGGVYRYDIYELRRMMIGDWSWCIQLSKPGGQLGSGSPPGPQNIAKRGIASARTSRPARNEEQEVEILWSNSIQMIAYVDDSHQQNFQPP